MSRPIIYIRRDAFDELLKYIGANGSVGKASIQTYNFIFMPETKVINIDDKEPVIIKRNGITIYDGE